MRLARAQSSVEELLLTGLIVSDEICSSLLNNIKPEFLLADHSRKILGWIKSYHGTYKKAPNVNIQNIYKVEKKNLKESEAEIISTFLSKLDQKYIESNTAAFNSKHIIEESIKFFCERRLFVLTEKVSGYLSIGKVAEAEKLIREFDREKISTVGTTAILSKSSISRIYEDGDSDILLNLPGDLGDMVGPLERSWFVAVSGVEKSGKSWLATELAVLALEQKRKVLFISHEMPEKKMRRRFVSRITGRPQFTVFTGQEYYPVLDCKRNQNDTCGNPLRIKKGIKLEKADDYKGGLISLINIGKNKRYTPCSACKAFPNSDYKAAYWFDKMEKRRLLPQPLREIQREMSRFENQFATTLEFYSSSKFKTTNQNIIDLLDTLEHQKGFRPDIIIEDYVDVRLSLSSKEKRHSVDEEWKMTSSIAQERGILWITPDQANAQARSSESITTSQTSESKTKDAHIDLRVALNRTPNEREDGVARVGVLFHREKQYSENKEVLILQNISIGQPLLDSAWL
jgi:hypothetical protein